MRLRKILNILSFKKLKPCCLLKPQSIQKNTCTSTVQSLQAVVATIHRWETRIFRLWTLLLHTFIQCKTIHIQVYSLIQIYDCCHSLIILNPIWCLILLLLHTLMPYLVSSLMCKRISVHYRNNLKLNEKTRYIYFVYMWVYAAIINLPSSFMTPCLILCVYIFILFQFFGCFIFFSSIHEKQKTGRHQYQNW